MVKFRYWLLFVSIITIIWGAWIPNSAAAGNPSQKVTTYNVLGQNDENTCLTEEDFWRLVHETRQALITKPVDFEPVQKSLVQRWQSASIVCLNADSQIYLENTYIVTSLNTLRGSDSDVVEMARLSDWLGNLETTRTLILADADPDAQSKLINILSQPEFQWKPEIPNPLTEWINQIVLRFFDWLNHLSGGSSFTLDGPLGLLLKLGLPFIAILLLGLLVLYIITSLRRSFSVAESANSILQPGDDLLDAEQALEKGDISAQAGDYRNALRYHYLSVLLTLDERGFLRFDKTRTNREYINTLKSRRAESVSRTEIQQITELLISIVETFEEVWYGFHAVDQDSYQSFRQQVQDLKRLAGVSRPAISGNFISTTSGGKNSDI